MARAIWTGSISFGLLNVPVRLYSAVSRKSVSFRELRASDSSRIRHRRVAEADGEEVPYEEIVKGVDEVTPEQYVVLTRDELEELDPQKTKAIEIQDFVDLDEIDPIYFDHPYYLGPDKGAEKAYALLVKAMADSNKVAIARFVLRSRENLAAIRSRGSAGPVSRGRNPQRLLACRVGTKGSEQPRSSDRHHTGSATERPARCDDTHGVPVRPDPGSRRSGHAWSRRSILEADLSGWPANDECHEVDAHERSQGEYRIFWVPPGSYYVNVIPPPDTPTPGGIPLVMNPYGQPAGRSLWWNQANAASSPVGNGLPETEAYLPIFFPGTPDESAATLLELQPGADARGIDIRVAPIRGWRVRGVVLNGTSRQPMPGVNLQLISLGPSPRVVQTTSDAMGRYAIPKVPPGPYVLAGLAPQAGAGRLMPLEVRDSDVETNIELQPFYSPHRPCRGAESCGPHCPPAP